MRILSLSAAVALLLSAQSAFAQDPPKKADASSVTPAPKKKAGKGKKKKAAAAQPPAPPKEEVAASEPAPAPAPAPAPTPVVVTQPAPEPVAQTTTTSAAVPAVADHDRVQKKNLDDVPPFSVAPLVGITSKDAYGIGFGVRAGYTLPMKLYIGGQFMYHLGPSLGGDASAPAFYPSVEIGYDLHPAKNLLVRPYGGGGVVFDHVSAGSLSATGHAAMIYPGCTVTYTIPSSPFFVGGDVRLMISPGEESRGNALGLFAAVGAQF